MKKVVPCHTGTTVAALPPRLLPEQPLVCAVWGASPAAHRRALQGGTPSARRRFTPANGSLRARGTDKPVHCVLGYYSREKRKMQHERVLSGPKTAQIIGNQKKTMKKRPIMAVFRLLRCKGTMFCLTNTVI
jgi:hypothetical protein